MFQRRKGKHHMSELGETEKIETYERYLSGEISEEEVREKLGDDVIDAMQEDQQAFSDAVEMLDTSEFLQDGE